MKYILVAVPGAADQPAEELGSKTPLELAKIPNLHHFAKSGKVGQIKLVSERYEPTADLSLLNLLGYDADKVYTGRGPLEAANMELKLEENEVAFRMNFITEFDGTLSDPTAGSVPTKEAKALINFLNKKISSDFVRFFPGTSYKHIAVLKDSHGYAALSARTLAPESFIGEKLEENLPKGPGDELLKKLMYDARLLLQDHEVNQVRVDLGENPANMIWLWGQGQKPVLDKFSEKFPVTGAVIAGAEYAQGIARLAGLSAYELTSTADDETRYDKTGKLLANVLAEKDFVCLYLDECDEASRKGDYKAKVSALESMDYFVFSKIRDFVDSQKEVRVVVTPCHVLPWKTKKVVRDYAPFVVAGKNIMPDDIEKFSENAAKASTLKMNKGSEFLKFFFAK